MMATLCGRCLWDWLSPAGPIPTGQQLKSSCSPSPDNCAKVKGGSQGYTLGPLFRDERSLLVVPRVLEWLGDSRQGNSTPLFPYAVPRPAGPPLFPDPAPAYCLHPAVSPPFLSLLVLRLQGTGSAPGLWLLSPSQLARAWLLVGRAMSSSSSGFQPVGCHPFDKPLSPKICTLQLITVAK